MRVGMFALAAALSIALTACGPSPEEKRIAAFVEAAKLATAEKLFDPASAQYRSLRYAKRPNGADVLCGEYNARNRMGGYVGFNAFVTATRSGSPFIVATPAQPRTLDSGIRCQAAKDKAFVWLDAHPDHSQEEFADATKDWDAMGCDDNDIEFWSVANGSCAAAQPIETAPNRP